MTPLLSRAFARWTATALLLCSTSAARAQEEAPPAPTPPTVEALATEAYQALNSAYYLQTRLEARFAVATNATEALMKENRARVRASEIDAVLRAEQQRLASTGIRMALSPRSPPGPLSPDGVPRQGSSNEVSRP